jgi:hypothetical protein
MATTAPVPPFSWGPNKIPVPYAAAWSAETVTVRGLTVRPDGAGLGYRDEVPGDRDRHGVLWSRMRTAPGEGRPNYRAMHAYRQRHTMLNLLCQICGTPADRSSQGWLFLTERPADGEASEDWPEGALSTKPPVCRPCAELAVRHCPHLTDPVTVRSRKPRVWGVFGGFFTPTATGRLEMSPEDANLPYGDPASRWFLASQLIIELTRCSEITEENTAP